MRSLCTYSMSIKVHCQHHELGRADEQCQRNSWWRHQMEKHFPRYWPFVWGIHWSPVNSPHKGQWRGALIFFICAWINGWVNNGEAGDLRHHRAHYDVTVMSTEVNAASSSCGGKQYVDERTEVNETRHTINTTDIYRMCWNILGKYPFLRDAIIHVCETTGLWSISTQKSIAQCKAMVTPMLVDWSHRSIALTHCGQVTPYGDIDRSQHWLRQLLTAPSHYLNPKLTSQHWGSVVFTWEQFNSEYPSYHSA